MDAEEPETAETIPVDNGEHLQKLMRELLSASSLDESIPFSMNQVSGNVRGLKKFPSLEDQQIAGWIHGGLSTATFQGLEEVCNNCYGLNEMIARARSFL
jgi:hypothetical protein